MATSIGLSGIHCSKNVVGPKVATGTTSNAFTFQTYRFGSSNSGSSEFLTAAIVNDTDAWAGGTVHTDSANGVVGSVPFDLAHWDGKGWTFEKVFPIYRGKKMSESPTLITGICAFSSTDIWLTTGAAPIHGDGKNWYLYFLPDYGIGAGESVCWGTSSGDMYFGGYRGGIVHYGGGRWTLINQYPYTDQYSHDICGADGQILVSGFETDGNSGLVYSIRGGNAAPISMGGVLVGISSVWFVPGQEYYVCADFKGLFEEHSLSDTAWSQVSKVGDQPTFVRGNGANDVFVTTADGGLFHFDGKDWTDLSGEISPAGIVYEGLAVKGNMLMAVGDLQSKAVIVIGKRN